MEQPLKKIPQQFISTSNHPVQGSHDEPVCAFCIILSETAEAKPAVYNTPIARFDNFILLPTLGPLAIGHVLAVTTTHTEGLLQCRTEIRNEYDVIAKTLREYCRSKGHGLLELEHGGRSRSGRSSCILHTHVHLFPGLNHLVNLFGSRLPPLDESPTKLTPGDVAYLWSRNERSEYTWDATEAIGQESRRALGAALDRDDWDWVVAPNPSTISSSIEYWRSYSTTGLRQ
ncbi:hypothetical protein ACGFMK_26025 [Amycolatopsis sp. NPDC049252]|uniref:hypothetical protein n=1 Tax=Amycolatopsis sp. NPDC049252 TaxID=3363933 RepID=UPI003722C14E